MPRASVGFLFPLLLALALPAAKAPSAPVPKVPAKKDSLYFPTKVGTKWVYTRGDEEQIEVVTAAGHKPKEQIWVVSIDRMDSKGKVKAQEEWEVSERGLRLLKSDGRPKRTEQWWLKLPHKAGAKWELLPDGDAQCAALEPKRVKVPAGEFDAVGVEVLLGETVIATRWYTPEIGLVEIGDDKKTICELKSFTPGKEE